MTDHTDFSFDERVVELYNRQRAHPPDVAQQIGKTIAAQVPAGSRLLEIGVGTGRIAWPVAVQNVDVIGFDLSPHMLQKVHADPPQITGTDENTRYNVQVAQANMHAMPYATNSMGAALAVHVLHLADDWQQVLSEMARVLQPGGAFIQGDDWIDPQSVVGMLRNELRMHAVRLDPSLMPPAAGISKADYLKSLGGRTVEKVVAAEWTQHISPADRLRIVEQRIDSESWILTDDLFEKVVAHLYDFAADHWDDLETPQPVRRQFVLTVTRGEWGVP